MSFAPSSRFGGAQPKSVDDKAQNDLPPSEQVHGPVKSPQDGIQQAAMFKGSFAPKDRGPQIPACRKDPNAGTARRLYIYFTQGWLDPDVWKSAFVEAMGTMCICYLSALMGITIVNTETRQFPAYVGIGNSVLIMLFIYATSPASGGHLNPAISFATMLSGLTGFPRAILYMLAQLFGSAVAGGLIRASFGFANTEKYRGGGCYLITPQVSPGQAFVIEMMSTFILLVLAFGVGLDPRAAENFGPLGPPLVGLSLGLVTFAGSNLVANGGYTGPSINPTRCFAFAVARGAGGFDSTAYVGIHYYKKMLMRLPRSMDLVDWAYGWSSIAGCSLPYRSTLSFASERILRGLEKKAENENPEGSAPRRPWLKANCKTMFD
ncbi:MAG: hypothetical protein M1834_005505 [Cirrosporium novae-zelandiae]|nr:MAG: hypothetical protein M1834_005505 [Cirrosporium novae-zelandiae]